MRWHDAAKMYVHRLFLQHVCVVQLCAQIGVIPFSLRSTGQYRPGFVDQSVGASILGDAPESNPEHRIQVTDGVQMCTVWYSIPGIFENYSYD